MDRSYIGGSFTPDVDALYVDDPQQLPFYDLLDKETYGSHYVVFTASIQESAAVTATAGANIAITIKDSSPWASVNYTESKMWDSPATTRYYCIRGSGDTDNTYIQNTGACIAKALYTKPSDDVVNNLAEQLVDATKKQYSSILNDVAQMYVGTKVVIGNTVYVVQNTQTTKQFNVDLRGFEGQLEQCMKYAKGTTYEVKDKWEFNNNKSDILNWFSVKTTCTVNKISLVATADTLITIPGVASRTHTDKPYDIFYMADTAAARKIAAAMGARWYSGGVIYDIQRLPYRPPTTGATSQTITYDGTTTTLYWLSSADFTKTSTSYTKSYWCSWI